jgi:hypothetical protein
MASDRKERRRVVISIDQFEEQFRRTFNREMTSEERRFYRLTMEMLDTENDEPSRSAARTGS